MNPPTVTVEPGDGSVVYYQPLSKETISDLDKSKIAILLKIKNNHSELIHLTNASISFPNDNQDYPIGSGFIEYDHMQGTDDEFPVYVWTIAVNEAKELKMHGGAYVDGSQQIIKSSPPSSEISIILKFLEDETPVVITKPLQTYASVGQVYRFPANLEDLKFGEFWHSPYSHWSGGNQMFAHDLSVVAWNSSKGAFSTIKGTSKTSLEDYFVWEKPVYAMADGEVISYENNVEDDPSPGGDFPPESFYGKGNGCGNRFIIRHGNDKVSYCHMKKGSLNPNILAKRGTVKVIEGDFLGLVGNSGHTTAPHLHIDAINELTGYLRPVLFKDIQVLSMEALAAHEYTQWAGVSWQGLPPVSTAIWPSIESAPLYPIPRIEKQWKALVEIIFGIIGDGGGLIVSHNTKKPLPNPPPDPLRNITDKRDVLLGLALTEIASLGSSKELRKIIRDSGIDIIKKAIINIGKEYRL